MMIRQEAPDDAAAVAALLADSFPTPAEARLVERLRADGDAAIALVAAHDGEIAAYAMFSPMAAPFRALGLGPVATRGEARRTGLASAVIVQGLARARDAGWEACFVLGNPRFYGRFGFRADLASGFDCAYAGPHFMAMGLQGVALPTLTGSIGYAKAFAGT